MCSMEICNGMCEGELLAFPYILLHLTAWSWRTHLVHERD